MTGQIRVSQAELQNLAGSIKRSTGEIRATLDALDSKVSTLRGAWTGEASNAYDTAHGEWSTTMTIIEELLGKFAASVEASATIYNDTEHANSSAWK